MKRFGVILSTFLIFSAAASDERYRDYMKKFEEMREKMLKDFHSPSSSLFESMIEDDFFGSDLGSGQLYSKKWKRDGSALVLELTPKSKKTPLDVQVKNGHVVVESKQASERSGDGVQSRSFSSAKEMIPLPRGIDSDRIKIAHTDSGIQIRMPSGDNSKRAENKDQNRVEKKDAPERRSLFRSKERYEL